MFEWKSYIPQTSEISRASKLFVFERDNDTIITLITLIGSDRFNAHTVAGILNEKIKEAFLDKTIDIEPITLVEKTLKKTRQNLIMFIRNEPDIQDIGIDMHVTILWIRDKTFYIGNAGDNDIILLRGKSIDIGEMIHNDQDVYHVGSGLLEEGDILLLGSPNTVDAFTETFITDNENTSWISIQDELKAINEQISGTQVIFSGRIIPEKKNQEEIIENLTSPTPYLPQQSNIQQADGIKGTIQNILQKIKPLVNKIRFEYFPVVSKNFVQLTAKVKAFINQKVLKNGKAEVPDTISNERHIEFPKESSSTPIGQEKPLSPWQRKLLSKLSFLPIKPKTNLSRIRPGKPVPFYQNPLFIVAVIGILLITFIAFSINKSLKNKKYTQNLAEINAMFDKHSTSLDDLKLQINSGTYDYEHTSRELITITDQIKNIDISSLKEEDQSSIKEKQTTKLNESQQLYNQINLIIPVSENNNLVFVFDTVTDCEGETKPQEFTKTGNYIAVVGADKKAICIYNLNTQTGTLIDKGKETIEDPISVASYPDGFYVLDKSNGVVKIETQKDGVTITNPSEFELTPVSALSARSVGSAIKIKWYSNNLYFLVPAEGKVLRARGNAGVFNMPEPYNDVAENKFTYATDFVIDGSIYVVTNSKQADSSYFNPILKYFGGRPSKLEINNPFSSIEKAGTAYTADGEHTPFLLVDKHEDYQRIIIFEKPYSKEENGERIDVHLDTFVLKNQIQYQGGKTDIFKNINSILSDPSLTTVYLLDGTKLIKINL